MSKKLSAIATLRKVFSVKEVKARYEKIGHIPVRNRYGDLGSGTSCLLGSFEHATRGHFNSHSETAMDTKVPENLLRAMEAGWEGWMRLRSKNGLSWANQVEDGRAKKIALPKKNTPLRLAYEHGQRLARILKPVEI